MKRPVCRLLQRCVGTRTRGDIGRDIVTITSRTVDSTRWRRTTVRGVAATSARLRSATWLYVWATSNFLDHKRALPRHGNSFVESPRTKEHGIVLDEPTPAGIFDGMHPRMLICPGATNAYGQWVNPTVRGSSKLRQRHRRPLRRDYTGSRDERAGRPCQRRLRP
jgi:hypothetical protein